MLKVYFGMVSFITFPYAKMNLTFVTKCLNFCISICFSSRQSFFSNHTQHITFFHSHDKENIFFSSNQGFVLEAAHAMFVKQ